MRSPEPASDSVRQQLTEVRETLLTLHKALLDSERTSYELVHGAVASPGAFLQLVIHDPWFRWLQPITALIVQIDEALAAKNPPKRAHDFELLIDDTRALLSPSREADGFWKRYAASVERDPAVAILHGEIEKRLANSD
ncbi:MAG TPA: hypothetical protein VF283_00425 [Bryobacteraceae bacterium]